MKSFGKVESRFWISPDIKRLSSDARLMAVYLLTCHHGNMLGVFQIPAGYICVDLDWDEQRVKKGLDELLRNGFITVCEATGFICIERFQHHNPAPNINVLKARVAELDCLPAGITNAAPVVSNLIETAKKFKDSRALVKRMETISKRFGNPLETVSEPVQNTIEIKRERERGRVKKEIKRHGRSPDLPSDSKSDFSEAFEHWWQQYPEREGAKGHKKQSYGYYKSRLADGHSDDDLLANVMRYGAYCQHDGIVGTRFVMRTTTYLNDPDNAKNQWVINHEARQRNNAGVSVAEQARQANQRVIQEELEREAREQHSDARTQGDSGVVYDDGSDVWQPVD